MRQRYQEDIYLKLYNNIKKAIIFEEFSQGEKLIESDLMDKYGVSRYILRGVIKRLENEGYVEAIPNRGARVRKISVEEIKEIYDLLILLEVKAAGLAASMSLNDGDLKKLKELLEDLVKKEAKRDYMGWLDCNDKLHLFISSLCGSNVLYKLIENLRKRIYRQRFAMSIIENIKEYNNQHKKIVRCIINKQKLAEKYMKLHLETAKRNRINLLNKFSISYISY